MPSGVVHLSNTLSSSLVLTVGSYFTDPALVSTNDCIVLVSGCMTGCLLGPDLDVDNGNISLYLLRKIPIIGFPLEKLWWLYWWPYRVIVPHRSPISHWPVLSTLIREVLVLWPYIVFCLVFSVPIAIGWHIFWVFTVGLTISDLQHWLADLMSKEIRI